MEAINATSVKKQNIGMIMAVFLFGIFMGAIDTGIVTPARTVIQNNLLVNEKTGIWMITIYTLAYASSIPVMGKLADKFGRKYIYLVSIGLFGLGSLFCGLSQDFKSFSLLLVARAVQAIGGGGIVPVATAEFGTTFPENKRGMALGLIGGVYGIANIFGSSAGSAILDIFGKNNWQFIFYINIPITIFVIIAGLIFLPNTRVTNVKRIDKFGIFFIVAMVLSLLYGLRNIDFFDFRNTLVSTDVYPFLIIFLLMLPFFIIAEKRAEDPVMNLSYFTNSKILITMIISFITGIIMMGMVFVPQFSENAVEIASGSGGYFVIILGVFAGVGAPVSGRLIDKFGPKIILAFGFLVSIAGALFLILVTTVHPNILTVAAGLLLIGLGMGFTIGAPLNYMMLENTAKEESNSALAALSLVRSIGTTVAPAIMIGFLAHAGGNIEKNITSILPSEVNAPVLPYSQELTEKIEKLKSDPNMKDKLSGVAMPDLAGMTKIKINMKSGGSFKMPADLLELLQTSDVTNITDRTKILAARMFEVMTPKVISDIQNGVQKGIEGMQQGITEMQKNLLDLREGEAGISKAIEKMQAASEGIKTGIVNMKAAVAQQESAIQQLNKVYSQTSNMPTGGGMPSGMSTQQGGMPALTDKATAGPPVSMLDMIPASVKEKMPKSVLEQLKDIKTPADLKQKILELTKVKNTLSGKISDMEKQLSEMLASINETKKKKAEMMKADSAISSAKLEMDDTVRKMGILKTAVPGTFEKAKDNYLSSIDRISVKIRSVYKNTLNDGFRQVYLTTAIAAFIAMLILFLYRRRKEIA